MGEEADAAAVREEAAAALAIFEPAADGHG
jgi:hypothetical protein